MIERLAVTWEHASLAALAALVCLSASLVSCPRVSVNSVSKAGVESTAAISSQGPIMVSLEDADRESREDDPEPCGLSGVRLLLPPPLTLSQITAPQSVWLSVLTPAHHPLRC